MPQTTKCLLYMKQGSALTLWQPNPNSLLTCMDYPSFPCDLGKNTEREGNASHIVLEITTQNKATLKLEMKWRWREGYEFYSFSGSRESTGDQDTWGRTGKANTCPSPVQSPKESCCLSCYYCSPRIETRIQPHDGWMSYVSWAEPKPPSIRLESVGDADLVP